MHPIDINFSVVYNPPDDRFCANQGGRDVTECICASIPRARLAEVISPANRLVDAFHLDCPLNGIKVLRDAPMRQVFKRGRLTRAQLAGLATLTPARVIEKYPDGQTALCEWVEWEFIDPEPEPAGEAE